VLRWRFRRNDQTLICELGLTGRDSAYELRIHPPWDPRGAVTEVFDDAMTVFARHAVIERALIEAGWSLEGFESHALAPRPEMPSEWPPQIPAKVPG
jgi:hypothetical protein